MGSHKSKVESYLVFDLGGGTLDISILEYEGSALEVQCYAGSNFLGGENINDCLYAHFKKVMKSKKIFLDNVELLRLRNFTERFKIDLCNKQLEADASSSNSSNDNNNNTTSSSSIDVSHSADFVY